MGLKGHYTHGSRLKDQPDAYAGVDAVGLSSEACLDESIIMFTDEGSDATVAPRELPAPVYAVDHAKENVAVQLLTTCVTDFCDDTTWN